MGFQIAARKTVPPVGFFLCLIVLREWEWEKKRDPRRGWGQEISSEENDKEKKTHVLSAVIPCIDKKKRKKEAR